MKCSYHGNLQEKHLEESAVSLRFRNWHEGLRKDEFNPQGCICITKGKTNKQDITDSCGGMEEGFAYRTDVMKL